MPAHRRVLQKEGVYTTDTQAGAQEQEESKTKMPQFLPKLRGQQVMVRMNDGRPLSGKLVSFNAYEIVLDAGPRTYLLFKHAIASIEVPKGILD
ncbi:MAG: RNA chaperone Hfq [Methanothrix sp.]|jgi:RNA chaperone Hfq|uniref:RNA chaperone Hfq n=2 Tax=Methanothrix sp. TaxID=90426 RepID=UPI00247E82AF|nr:RNA chaperone Hfq [Methanothrix sp.]